MSINQSKVFFFRLKSSCRCLGYLFPLHFNTYMVWVLYKYFTLSVWELNSDIRFSRLKSIPALNRLINIRRKKINIEWNLQIARFNILSRFLISRAIRVEEMFLPIAQQTLDMSQCYIKLDTPSTTLAQHWSNIGCISRVFCVGSPVFDLQTAHFAPDLTNCPVHRGRSLPAVSQCFSIDFSKCNQKLSVNPQRRHCVLSPLSVSSGLVW